MFRTMGVVRGIICLLFVHNMHCVQGDKKPLYVGVLLEQSQHWYASYANFFPTIFEYALQGVDNTSDILSEYEIKLIVRDTQGSPGIAVIQLIEMLQEDPPKVAIIGPLLSASLTVVGQIVPYYHVIELSCIATTATTSDRDLFSTLFKVNPDTNSLNSLRIKMMKYFGWTRVGTIAYQEEFSVSEIDAFHGLLRDNNMTLVTSAVISETSDIPDILKRYKQFNVRIIMAAFRGAVGPSIFCEAYHQGMYGDSHVWILSGPTIYRGWVDGADESSMGCTKAELITATNGIYILDHLRESKSNEASISGKTPGEVMDDLTRMISTTDYMMSSFAGWVYDTPWALSVGLNNSIKYLAEAGLQLHQYNYSSVYLDAVVKGMRDVSFSGVSGPVSFDDIGSRVGISFIQQHFDEVRNNIASYDEDEDNLTWIIDSSTLWSGREVPHDNFIYHDVLVSPSGTAFTMMVSLGFGGCLLSFTFLFFNIYYKKNKSIKMSSPMVNNVIIAGCLITYIEIFISAIDYKLNRGDNVGSGFCIGRTWLLSIGFTSLFGALFSKTYRVYVVFRDYKLKRRAIKDYHLFGIMGILLVVDCLILIPWTILNPLEKEKHTKSIMDVMNNNMILSESYLHCHNDYNAYWLIGMYVYKGLLLAFGTFLAWETRQITVPALNDSKYIGACIYNVVIVCLFGVPLTYVLPIEQRTLTFVLESSLLFFCTTMCQCIIFIPKIKSRNQVHGRFLTSQMPTEAVSSALKPNTSTQGIQPVLKDIQDIDHAEVKTKEELKCENEQLRMDIANEAISIAKLRKTLLQLTGDLHFYKSGPDYVVFKSTGLGSASAIALHNRNEDIRDKSI